MTWYCVYSTATNAAISFTTTEPDGLPAGLGFVTVDHQPDASETWDPATKAVVGYTPVPTDPTGAFYELPNGAGWQWVYAIANAQLPAKAPTQGRTAQPSDASAKSYISANAPAGDLDAAISAAAARRDRILAALQAAGVANPTQAPAYVAAQDVLAFLGGCL